MWALGLGCLWDWTQSFLATKYLLRSWAGRGLLLLYWAAWFGLGWWLLHGLPWYWALGGALALYLTGNVAAGLYSLRELQQWESYKTGTKWLAEHPKLKALRDKLGSK